jgi:hypothetical protein
MNQKIATEMEKNKGRFQNVQAKWMNLILEGKMDKRRYYLDLRL